MSNETQQETWNATHAQLLKSVADAQCKLLAAQNETIDKLEGAQRDIVLRLEAAMRGLNGRLDAIGSILAELLKPQAEVSRKRRRKR